MNGSYTFNSSSINATILHEAKQSDYDHEGAMKFIVCVVLVYGVGVIGVLGMYTHRRRKDIIEQETNAFVKTYETCKEVMERKQQLCTVRDLIKNVPENQSPTSCGTSLTSLASPRPPLIRPQKLTLRTDPSTFHKLGNRGRNSRSATSLNCTPDSEESAPLFLRAQGSFKYKGSCRRASSERERCILETPETEDTSEVVPFRFTVVDVDDVDDAQSLNTDLNSDISRLGHSNSSVEPQTDSVKGSPVSDVDRQSISANK